MPTAQMSINVAKRAVGICDIGAFESQGFTLAISGGDAQRTQVNTNFAERAASDGQRQRPQPERGRRSDRQL